MPRLAKRKTPQLRYDNGRLRLLESLNKESVGTKDPPQSLKRETVKVAGGKTTTGNTEKDVHEKSPEKSTPKERGASQ